MCAEHVAARTVATSSNCPRKEVSLFPAKHLKVARALPLFVASCALALAQPVSMVRDTELFMPVEGVYLSQVSDTWGAARSEGRNHEGVDIFASEGTLVYSATPGYVEWRGPYGIGGNTVTVMGAGRVRYYYAHLSGYAEGIENGQVVTTETLLGYVGTTGNAATTPPHLHFSVYTNGWNAENPYPLLVDRVW